MPEFAASIGCAGGNAEEAVAVSVAQREPLDARLTNADAGKLLGAMPFMFARNDGQWPKEIRFAARRYGMSAAFTDQGMTLAAPTRTADGEPAIRAVAFEFFGDAAGRAPHGETQLRGVHHYVIGNDPTAWRSNVPLFESVRYDEVAPGVALLVTDRDGSIAYDLHVEPGADLEAVEIACSGIDSVELEPDGALKLSTPDGGLRQSPPKAWYEGADGERRLADCRFEIRGPKRWGFTVEQPDPDSRLIVDPTVGLTWSTFLGSNEDDACYGVDFQNGLVTATGSSLFTPPSASVPFPVTAGVFQVGNAGNDDVFVSQLDPAQSGSAQLIWSTLIGGSGHDIAKSLDLSSNGSVAVCGTTNSGDFPTSSGAYNSVFGNPGGYTAFALLLSNNGTTLQYSTYYGPANATARANSIKIDSATSQMTFVGYVEGTIPLVLAYDINYDGKGDAFIARVDPGLSGTASLVYSSYVGNWPGSAFSAPEYDEAFAVFLENQFVYLVGTTVSVGFHTRSGNSAPIFDFVHGTGGATPNKDCFVMRHRPDLTGGAQVSYCTFVGSDEDEEAFGVDVSNAVIYFCGYTKSPGFPVGSVETTGGAVFDSTINVGLGKDAFAFKFDPTQPTTSLQKRYSSLLGGTSGFNDEVAYSIVRVNNQCMLCVGMTESASFPTAAPGTATPFDTSLGGVRDGFLSRFRWNLSTAPPGQLDYSTFMGGAANDELRSVVLDSTVEAYFGGFSASFDYPTTLGAFDRTFNSGATLGDAILGWFTCPPVTAP